VKVELTEEEWSRLLNAAALAPYAQIALVIQNVVQQLQAAKQGPPEKGSGSVSN
jgi:hypothetical protein